MKTKLPSLNYSILKAAQEECSRARGLLYDAGGTAKSVDDARTLGMAAEAADQAADAVFEFLNVLANHADAPGALEAMP